MCNVFEICVSCMCMYGVFLFVVCCGIFVPCTLKLCFMFCLYNVYSVFMIHCVWNMCCNEPVL